LQIQKLTCHIYASDLQVVLALPIGKAAWHQLAGFSIDEVGGEGTGVPAEQSVRQRHITPEETHDMQPYEEDSESIGKTGGGIGAKCLGIQRPIGQRKPEVSCHQCGREFFAVFVQPTRDDRYWLHTGNI
jgi:hypothetical protein